jgi:hypothetical protein
MRCIFRVKGKTKSKTGTAAPATAAASVEQFILCKSFVMYVFFSPCKAISVFSAENVDSNIHPVPPLTHDQLRYANRNRHYKCSYADCPHQFTNHDKNAVLIHEQIHGPENNVYWNDDSAKYHPNAK